MSKSIKEQLKAVQKIMKIDEPTKLKSYAIKGKTFMYKEDLASWGWSWNHENKYWFIKDIEETDASLRIVQGIEGTWVEEIN